MLGQVIYHVLAAAHATRAPWPVVVLVSCLPVVTLGFGAALTHLLRAVGDVSDAVPIPAPEAVAEAVAQDTHETEPDAVSAPIPTDNQSAALIALRATLAADNPLSGRQLETRFGLTRAEATRVRELVTVESNGHLATANGEPS
jgi:hypothetical protein